MKKIIAFLKKYQLIIVLSLIAGVLAGYKLFFTPSQNNVIDNITPSPTPSPTISQDQEAGQGISEQEFMKSISRNYPLTPYLPYPGEKYTIIYTDELEIEVSAQQATASASRQEVLDWMEKQGIDPSTHRIIWQFE